MLKNISRILPFFIVTLLCISGVELLYGVAEHYLLLPVRKAKLPVSEGVPAAEQVKKLEKHKNYQVILDRNLFQSYIREPQKVEPVQTNPLEGLEATSLNLVLMGTISGPKDRSRAIIMEKAKKKQDIYYQGDVIQGAEIKEILRGKVILTYQGRDEILDMTEAIKYKPRQSAAVAPVPNKRRVISSPKPARRPAPVKVKTRKVTKVRPRVQIEADDADPEGAENEEPGEETEVEEIPENSEGRADY